MKSIITRLLRSACPLALLALTACGGGGGGAVPPPPPTPTLTYSVGGTISGLVGSVVLQNNGGDNLTVTANGNFTFATKLNSGAAYSVSILTQPSGQICSLSSNTGTINGGNVTSVTATCVAIPTTYSVGGTLTGLSASNSLVLTNNGTDNLTLSANGAFTFPTKLSNGAPYSVSILTQPSGQTCSLSSNTGTINGGNVTSVTATCVGIPATYSVGGTLTGLASGNSLVLTNNGTDNLTLSANGAFTFPIKLSNGSAYSVSILTQPSGQTCSLSSSTGTINGGNVTSVTATCASSAATYSVGGTLTGLSAGNSIVLTNNGTDTLTLNADGPFTFPTKLSTGAAYHLTLGAPMPVAQPCTSTYGAGVINGANATSLNVICGLPGGLGTFTQTSGLMLVWRMAHTATRLPNGKVLVCGGQGRDFTILNSAELYDPATGKWAATGSMLPQRLAHTATLLANGKVLVCGGSLLDSAELYDPATGLWTATGSLTLPRWSHTATLLPNGTVLVSGGENGTGLLDRTEVYNPATGTWTAAGSLVTPRYHHTATLLPTGKVLLSGGFGGAAGAAGSANPVIVGSAELYDPVSMSWTATGPLVAARHTHTATLLPNGKVLISGGAIGNVVLGGPNGTMAAIASSELYDPATGLWTATGSLLRGRFSHTETLLPSGLVMVCGGWGIRPIGSVGVLDSAELYDPATGNWAATGAMVTLGNSHAATLLSSGKVLVSGGGDIGYAAYLGIAEEYF